MRRLLGTRKVGHAGTLDPMATGVLLIGVGRATRLLGHLAGHDKSYTATIRLGQATHTDDADGELVSATGASGITETDVRAAVAGFLGRISQVPSAVSAIKVDGKRAYARVRAGEDVELAAREVTVSRFEILSVRPASVPLAKWTERPQDATKPSTLRVEGEVLDVDVIVDCSTGTYIRALARDLGTRLGCGGHLTALRRTRVGVFDTDDITVDQAVLAGDERPALLSLGEVGKRAFPNLQLSDEQATDVGYGRAIQLALPADPTALLTGDRLLALYRPDGEWARPVTVLVG